jgi:hypothetical protein
MPPVVGAYFLRAPNVINLRDVLLAACRYAGQAGCLRGG